MSNQQNLQCIKKVSTIAVKKYIYNEFLDVIAELVSNRNNTIEKTFN